MKYSVILGVVFALGIGTFLYQRNKQEQESLIRMQAYIESLPMCDMKALTNSIKETCMRDNGYPWFVPKYIYYGDKENTK